MPEEKLMRKRKLAGLVLPGMWMIVIANGVEPARVVVADQPLLVQPLEASVVLVELKWLVQEILVEGAQRVHHCQELETVGG